MCAFAPYDMDNVKVVGFDVVTNRPKVAAYGPGAPISEYAVECVVDELAQKLSGSRRTSPEERGEGRHPRRLRSEIRPDRLSGTAVASERS